MRLSLGSVDTVAQAIQTQEGFYAGTLAYINSNPGNLMPAGQPGCTVGAGGFCSFPTYEQGYQALLNQISLDASRGYTILQFTTKYLGGDPNNPGTAPGGDPNIYASNIAAAAGLSPSDPLSMALADGSPAIYDPGFSGGTVDAGMLPAAAGALDPLTVGLVVGAALLVGWMVS